MTHFIIDTWYSFIVPYWYMPIATVIALYGLTRFIIENLKDYKNDKERVHRTSL